MVNGTGIVKQIVGADSPETAYVVKDYPYGFRLRTTLRSWIEHNPRYGERAVTQTINPKNGKWNKIKAGTYNSIEVLGVDEHGHLCFDALGPYRSEEEINAFAAKYQLNERQRKTAEMLLVVARGNKHITITVRTVQPGDPPGQTEAEGKEILRRAAIYELSQLKTGETAPLPAGPGPAP